MRILHVFAKKCYRPIYSNYCQIYEIRLLHIIKLLGPLSCCKATMHMLNLINGYMHLHTYRLYFTANYLIRHISILITALISLNSSWLCTIAQYY